MPLWEERPLLLTRDLNNQSFRILVNPPAHQIVKEPGTCCLFTQNTYSLYLPSLKHGCYLYLIFIQSITDCGQGSRARHHWITSLRLNPHLHLSLGPEARYPCCFLNKTPLQAQSLSPIISVNMLNSSERTQYIERFYSFCFRIINCNQVLFKLSLGHHITIPFLYQIFSSEGIKAGDLQLCGTEFLHFVSNTRPSVHLQKCNIKRFAGFNSWHTYTKHIIHSWRMGKYAFYCLLL